MDSRRVIRQELDGSLTVIANSFQGRRLNRPNDVVGGLWMLDPQGKELGRIVHGQPVTTNMGFGGNDWKTLYFTTRTHLCAVHVKIPGITVPTQKK